MGLLNDWRDWVVGQLNNFDYIGIGNSTDAYSASQSGLQGSNTFYAATDSGYPSITDNVLITQATVGASDAQFAWNEVVICDGTPGVVINRDVIPFGTKDNVEWQLELEFTLELVD